ncbi:MAG: ABC transporter permease, partial [Eubacteriales bacterium]
MKRLFAYLAPYKAKMTLGFIIKSVGSVMDLFLPWILSHIIDKVIPTKDIRLTVLWGCVMILCSFAAWSGNIIANRMASRVAGECTRAIRHDLFETISYLDASTVDRLTVSSLESRITSDTYNVHGMVGMAQRLGVRAPILLIGGLVVAFLLDARLTLMLALTMPFIALSVFVISSRGVKLYKRLQGAVDNIVAVVRENATGVRVIKALGKTEYEKKRFEKVNKTAIGLEKKAGTTMALTNPLITFFLNMGLCAVILAGAYWVDGGLSTNGKIIAFLSYFTI